MSSFSYNSHKRVGTFTTIKKLTEEELITLVDFLIEKSSEILTEGDLPLSCPVKNLVIYYKGFRRIYDKDGNTNNNHNEYLYCIEDAEYHQFFIGFGGLGGSLEMTLDQEFPDWFEGL